MKRLENENEHFSDEEGYEEEKVEGNQTYKESFSLNSSVIRNSITEKQK
jgi:hypothetical protein